MLFRSHRQVFLVGIKKQPHDLLIKNESLTGNPDVRFCKSLDEAVILAKEIITTPTHQASHHGSKASTHA